MTNTHREELAGLVAWQRQTPEQLVALLRKLANHRWSEHNDETLWGMMCEAAKKAASLIEAASPPPVQPVVTPRRSKASKFDGRVHQITEKAIAESQAEIASAFDAKFGSGDETGWLVELKGQTPQWAILSDDYDEHWTADASKALRFARKEDADAYIAHYGWTEAFASEHMWTSSPTLSTKTAAPLEAGAVQFYDEHNCPVCHAPQPVADAGDVAKKERLGWQSMPAYGEVSFIQLVEAVGEAIYANRKHVHRDIDPDRNIGHQIVPTINFN